MIKYLKKTESFTLIEIIIVVIIVGILAGLALPRYEKTLEKSRKAEAYSVLKSIHDAQMRYATRNSAYAANSNDLDINVPAGKYFSFTIRYNDPVPSPIDSQDDILAYAFRDIPADYYILISESGEMWEEEELCVGSSC